MNQSLSEWRSDNISSLVIAGLSIGEATKIVERIIANDMRPVVTDTISKEDIIDAIAEWAVQSPLTEANILNAS